MERMECSLQSIPDAGEATCLDENASVGLISKDQTVQIENAIQIKTKFIKPTKKQIYV